jgi:hypothetical protein
MGDSVRSEERRKDSLCWAITPVESFNAFEKRKHQVHPKLENESQAGFPSFAAGVVSRLEGRSSPSFPNVRRK